MAKANAVKITVGDKMKADVLSLKEIEQFVLDSGSDDLPTFGGTFEGGAHIQQIPDEIAGCIKAILDRIAVPKVAYLEVGVAAGGTAFLFNHFLSPTKVVLVDDNKHHKAGLRPQVLQGIEYHELIGRSLDEPILQAAKDAGPYDIIMLDGDHSYAGAKLDTVLYLEMLNPGGFLVYHDSAYSPEVARVVRELKNDSAMEFIDEFMTNKYGRRLGVALFRKVGK